MKRSRLAEFYTNNRYFFHVKLYIFQYITLPTLEHTLQIIIFNLAEERDPCPRRKRSEAFLDYYKRIDYRYALRHSKFFRNITRYEDNQIKHYVRLGILDNLPKKLVKAWEENARIKECVARECEENYETVLVRKRVEEEMNRESLLERC